MFNDIFRKLYRISDNVEMHYGEGQATDGNMAQAHRVLSN